MSVLDVSLSISVGRKLCPSTLDGSFVCQRWTEALSISVGQKLMSGVLSFALEFPVVEVENGLVFVPLARVMDKRNFRRSIVSNARPLREVKVLLKTNYCRACYYLVQV